MQSIWNKHIFVNVPVHVCGCVCRRWGAVICECNSDGEISSRCVTAAHKVSAAVIRIPLSREEQQPTLPDCERDHRALPRRSPTLVPNGAYFNCCKKKIDSRSQGTVVSSNALTWLGRLALRKRPHSHSARDVLGLIYAAPYSVWLRMHFGMWPGCRMINLEDLGCVHTGSVENMNEADPFGRRSRQRSSVRASRDAKESLGLAGVRGLRPNLLSL